MIDLFISPIYYLYIVSLRYIFMNIIKIYYKTCLHLHFLGQGSVRWELFFYRIFELRSLVQFKMTFCLISFCIKNIEYAGI
jgi:hypothetical protein